MFEDVEIETKHNRPLTAALSYMRPKRKGEHKKGAKPQLLISIPTSIAAISKKKFFQLRVGKDKDAGKARIVGQNVKNNFTIEPRTLMHTVIFNFGFVPSLGDDIADREDVAVRKITDDEFEVDLPAWWRKGPA